MSLLSLDDTGHALQRRQGAHKVFTARNDRRVVGGVKSAPSNHVGPMPFSYNDVAVRHCDAEGGDVVEIVRLPPSLRISMLHVHTMDDVPAGQLSQ